MILIKKTFYISDTDIHKKEKSDIDELNQLLNTAGIFFDIREIDDEKTVIVNVDEDTLNKLVSTRGGRPIKYDFDYEDIKKMKASGMTDKEIYTSLGISKSLYYMKKKEYIEKKFIFEVE